MIHLTGVNVTYRSGDVTALHHIHLHVPPGDFVFLVGPTGAGKSTLLKLLYHDIAPTNGNITVAGFDLTRLRARDIPRLRRKMGIVLQDYGLLPQRTVWENIAFACQVLGQSHREIRRKLPEVLELVRMGHRCDAFPGELSGGEQQRVAIARALVNQPPLLIADEPTGNLDPETGEGILQVLEEANQRGATLIVATHDKAAVDRMRKRVVALRGGRIIRDETNGAYESSGVPSSGVGVV
ncbi:MAG: cell division ATP-binding protein FtsE [Capsulimonadales bacterium]|nr:cell division ATP-binding protein FtsE [Capsulimonadales bacterium]